MKTRQRERPQRKRHSASGFGVAVLRRLFRILVVAFTFSAALESVNATSYQVGPTRSYTNLQAGASRLLPGDVVEVDGGVTYSGGVTFRKDGSATERLGFVGRKLAGTANISKSPRAVLLSFQ